MSGFSVKVKPGSLRRLQSKLDAGELYQEPIQKGITNLGLFTERTARMGAPRDTAALQRSIMTESKPLQARIHSNLAYHPVMEAGRRAGSRMPPPAALADWARRKGFQGSLFVLARSIAPRGIKGRFYMRKAAKAARAKLPDILGDMAKDIEARWSKGG